MSAINFKLDVSRRTDPGGDRVVVTFDGKFLDYQWRTPAALATQRVRVAFHVPWNAGLVLPTSSEEAW